MYDLIFAQGGTLASDPHGPNAREHVTVIEGVVRVTSGEASDVFYVGDTARYGADVKHVISAVDGPARAFLIVESR